MGMRQPLLSCMEEGGEEEGKRKGAGGTRSLEILLIPGRIAARRKERSEKNISVSAATQHAIIP